MDVAVGGGGTTVVVRALNHLFGAAVATVYGKLDEWADRVCNTVPNTWANQTGPINKTVLVQDQNEYNQVVASLRSNNVKLNPTKVWRVENRRLYTKYRRVMNDIHREMGHNTVRRLVHSTGDTKPEKIVKDSKGLDYTYAKRRYTLRRIRPTPTDSLITDRRPTEMCSR